MSCFCLYCMLRSNLAVGVTKPSLNNPHHHPHPLPTALLTTTLEKLNNPINMSRISSTIYSGDQRFMVDNLSGYIRVNFFDIYVHYKWLQKKTVRRWDIYQYKGYNAKDSLIAEIKRQFYIREPVGDRVWFIKWK